MINALLYAPQLLEFILGRVNQILLLKIIVAAPLIHDHHQMRRTDHHLTSVFLSFYLEISFFFFFLSNYGCLGQLTHTLTNPPKP
jgi:hypothetical protein